MNLKTIFFTLGLLFTSTFLMAVDQSGLGLNLPSQALKPLPENPPTKNKARAEQIIKTMDNKRSYPNAMMIGTMYTKDSYTSKSQKMRMYSRGDIDTLVEMTDGESKGQKMLRTEHEIYLYMPDLDRQIRLSGASLRQSFAGSDLSYEDLTSIKKTLDNFDVSYLGEDKAFGYNTSVIYLVEKKDKNGKTTQAYPIQKLWVDKVSFLPVRSESYSPTKKLLKEMNIIKYKQIEGYSIPMEMVIQDKLKKNTSTRVVFSEVDIHAKITDRTFSLESLTF